MSTRLMNQGISAIDATQKDMEIRGNNAANIMTTGFKASSATYATSFTDLIRPATPSTAGSSGQMPLQVGLGTTIAGTSTDFTTPGEIVNTGIPTHVAVVGNAFLRVKDPSSGSQYVTKVGEGRIDNLGYYVNPNGLRYQGLSDATFQLNATKATNGDYIWNVTNAAAPTTVGDLRIPNRSTFNIINNTSDPDATVQAAAPTPAGIQINSAGNIQLVFDGSIGSVTVGTILLQAFNDPSALNAEVGGMYSGFEAAGPINSFTGSDSVPGMNGLSSILAGQLESSNVDLTQELAGIIIAQRALQVGVRLVDAGNQALTSVINLGA